MPATEPTTNGQLQTRGNVEEVLAHQLTEGYRPSLPDWAFGIEGIVPQIYLMRDIELMIIHPMVRSVLNYFKAGIAGVSFWGGPDSQGTPTGKPICADQRVTDFVLSQCHSYWNSGVPALQGGYEYGWMGAENIYAPDPQGLWRWQRLVQFCPRDVFLLTQDEHPVGVRVKQVRKKGQVDLFMGTADVPAKGLWYSHEPRYHGFYGQSQLLGAWRPWRRLASRDGVEAVADMGIFRYGVPPVIVSYPDEDLQGQPGAPATTNDSEGNPRRYARDMARQIGQWLKSGASVGTPSTQYPPEQGGGKKWEVDIPKSTLNITGLIEYIRHLWDQISHGIGVPPELLEASNSGSGFSGRKIPREAFIMRQQRIADALLLLFVEEVLRPLVRWNFGHIEWDIQIKPMLEEERRSQQGTSSPGQAPGSQQPFGSMGNGSPLGATPPQTNVQQGWGEFSLNHPMLTDKVKDVARHIFNKNMRRRAA